MNFREDVIEIEARVLSIHEWMSLEHSVPFPQKVQTGVNASGPVYDYNDNGYQQALRDRKDRVALKRMAASLQGKMEGETNDQKADWLSHTFPVGLLQSIYAALEKIHAEGEATIKHRRDSFHPNGNTPTEGDREIEPHA